MKCTIPTNQLLELREIFREEFKSYDFCIGKDQVERVFRELLNEPEPCYPIEELLTFEEAKKRLEENLKSIVNVFAKKNESLYNNHKHK